MASFKFKRRQRAKRQRIEGNGGFVPIRVAVEYNRERQEKEEKKMEANKRGRVEAFSPECSDLEYLSIDMDSALTKKTLNDILEYKKGAEDTLKSKAPYLGTSRASFFRKKLPTLEQNSGFSLEMFGFTVKKTADTSKKRSRKEMEEENSVTSQAETLERSQMAAKLNTTD